MRLARMFGALALSGFVAGGGPLTPTVAIAGAYSGGTTAAVAAASGAVGIELVQYRGGEGINRGSAQPRRNPPPRGGYTPPGIYSPRGGISPPRGGYGPPRSSYVQPRAYGPPRGGYYAPPPYYGPRGYAAPYYRGYRPWYGRPYYGTIIGGIALGAIIGATAYGLAPRPPRPDLCWYWADEFESQGYWDYC